MAKVDSNTNTHAVIAWVASAALLAVSLLVAKTGSTYQWSFAFLIPLIWAVYFFRHLLVLQPSHFALFAVAVIIHDLGSLGFYNRVFLGLRFDTYVHFFFGLVAGLVLFHAARTRLPISPTALAIVVPIFILGIGGIHELFECFTTLLLGPERGMLKLRPNEPFDTQKDLMNNLIGAVLGVLMLSFRRPRRTESVREPGEGLKSSDPRHAW